MTPEPDDDKPDPLDRLRTIYDWGATTSSDRELHLRWIAEAVAAWEKERAETPLAHVMAVERDKWMEKYHALRAQVEKESAQMREDAKRLSELYGYHGAAATMIASADALDAALGGGA